jgi:hypothetical protein
MTPDSARNDLAYLRGLVQPDERWSQQFGAGYIAAGSCYGGQFLMHAGQALGLLPAEGPAALAIGVGPTAVFLLWLVLVLRRGRTTAEGGVTARAVGAVFSAVGLANLAAAAVVGSVALRQQSLTVWLIFPCIVMVFQGAAWLVAYALRRRAWFALVGGGWFVAGVAAAACIERDWAYLSIAGLAFLLLMLLPGVVITRRGARQG